MKITELPEAYKIYVLVMSNKSEYEITGTQKEAIMESETQWIGMPNGSTINKAFGIEIRLDMDKTRENAQKHLEELRALEPQNTIEGTVSNVEMKLQL